MRLSLAAVPDELSEEMSGVPNDASRPGLLVLTQLQNQPVVHMTLQREDGLRTRQKLTLTLTATKMPAMEFISAMKVFTYCMRHQHLVY